MRWVQNLPLGLSGSPPTVRLDILDFFDDAICFSHG
jgi:hypothetical protein